MASDADYDRLREWPYINKLALDDEFMMMPELVMQAGEGCAAAILLRDEAESALKVAQAAAADSLRRSGKRSETQIASELNLDPDVVAARAASDLAKYRAGLWLAVVDKMRCRRDSLEGIAKLVVSGYTTRDSFVRESPHYTRNNR